MKDSIYYKQVELLLRVLPVINRHDEFALKGGTAINFFVRDFPRFSIDIDLVYLPLKERDETLADLTNKLKKIRKDISKCFENLQIADRMLGNSENLSGLLVTTVNATIKIEVNTVIRGSVFEPEQMGTMQKG
ncbi:MAG: hypothetical protein SCALA702_33030 [Melioribacteraceae bacterium]|nr:MAG: hypothetical protein SCALA702_33030 [Melioribacteraceae bacterium]